MTEWDYVLALTESELHKVTIVHDNPSFEGPNCVIIFSNYEYEIFYSGETKLECLKEAYKEHIKR